MNAMQADLMETANWGWGLSLIAVTIAIHAIGIVLISLVFLELQARTEKLKLADLRAVLIVVGLVTAAGFFLVVLHGLEAALWAAAFICLGALDSPLDALLYSVDSMATRGSSGLTLQRRWRMMGALEAVNDMLLFGISTAYLFTIMRAFWQMLPRAR
jgi:hypothetical protein